MISARTVVTYWLVMIAGVRSRSGGSYRFFHGGGRVLTDDMTIEEIKASCPVARATGVFERN